MIKIKINQKIILVVIQKKENKNIFAAYKNIIEEKINKQNRKINK